MMIQQALASHYNKNKLHNSYLITANSMDKAYLEVSGFLSQYLFTNIKDSSHPDISIVRSNDQNIVIKVDQIRKLQEFLYKTSPISGIKVGVIMDAANMNINAFNSCLKLLEDTPSNSYLFLITKYASLIPETILSRCVKLYHNYDIATDVRCKEEYIIPLLNESKIEEKLQFIQKISSNIELWNDFVDNMQLLLTFYIKNTYNHLLKLSEVEKKLLRQIESEELVHLLSSRYSKIQDIVHNVRQNNIDLLVSTMLIIDIVTSKQGDL